MKKPINQPLRIGVIGGGQLGSMLLRSALDFGFHISVLDSNAEGTCAPFVRSFTHASPNDTEAVVAFGKDLDVVTIEMEAVSVEALEQLEAAGVTVYPQSWIVKMVQDKGVQKEYLQSHGFPVAAGKLIGGKAELKAAIDSYPMCLKARRGGYDGQGVMMLRNEGDLEEAFDVPSVLEEAIEIDREIAVIVARNADGQIAVYEPVSMAFAAGKFILDYQFCPAEGITQVQAGKAQALATRLMRELEMVGLLAVEMFLTKSGEILINEIAPRPHNSGHHTIEACVTSQYEQLLRAICNLPLGSTETLMPSGMVNFLEPAGNDPLLTDKMLRELLSLPAAHVHWYGKSGGKEGRKMGHVTIAHPNTAQVKDTMQSVKEILAKK